MAIVGTDSIYSLTVVGSFSSQITRNVFWYRSTAFVNVVDLATAFGTLVKDAWEDVASISWTASLIEAEEIDSEANFGEAIIDWTGQAVGEALPPQSAYDIKLVRATKATRNGRKRLCGVAEANQNAGGNTASSLAALQVLADLFADSIEVDSVLCIPVIVRKTYTPDPPNSPILNPVEDWIYTPIESATAQQWITTQNSRKYRTG